MEGPICCFITFLLTFQQSFFNFSTIYQLFSNHFLIFSSKHLEKIEYKKIFKSFIFFIKSKYQMTKLYKSFLEEKQVCLPYGRVILHTYIVYTHNFYIKGLIKTTMRFYIHIYSSLIIYDCQDHQK